MVFSSISRLYQDPPNWQSQLGSSTNDNSQLPLLLPPPPSDRGGDRPCLTRPISVTDRARFAKLPQPETALNCPRCESTNTKFCYFNNYSLSQPRHFCKTCRRYWTRGGALRNIPIGGGCRRNKRTKGSTSKSPVTADNQTVPNCSSDCSTTSTTVSSSSCTTDFFPQYAPHQQPQLPFLPSLDHVSGYGAGDVCFDFSSDLAGAILELPSWRLQQFQQLQFSEPTAGIFQFERNDGIEPQSTYVAGDARDNSVDCVVNQLGVVKPEENAGVDLSRIVLGMDANEEYWGGSMNINAWTTDLINMFTP